MEAYLEKMRATRSHPGPETGLGPAMEYFYGVAESFCDSPLVRRHKEAKGKVVGFYCLLAPLELIHAAGAIPVRLCSGYHETVSLAEDILTGSHTCPLVKSSIGNQLAGCSPDLEACDAVIAPLTCDAKTRLGDVLEDHVPVWRLMVPRLKNERYAGQWLDEFKELKYRLEKLTGQSISRKVLKDSIYHFHRIRSTFRRFHALRRSGVPLIWGRDALLVVQTMLNDPVRWVEQTDALCDRLEAIGKEGEGEGVCSEDTPRVMLVGSPIMWPNWKIPQVIEETGGVIVCDELCSGTRSLYDPTVLDEKSMTGMLAALAERYLLPCTCPCFSPNDQRIDNILRMVEEFRVQGVVYHILGGCHLSSFEVSRVERALKERGIPMLTIESTYDIGDTGQMKLRVEAFLEMIRMR